MVSGLTAAVYRPVSELASVHNCVFVLCHLLGPRTLELCGEVSTAYLHPLKLLISWHVKPHCRPKGSHDEQGQV